MSKLKDDALEPFGENSQLTVLRELYDVEHFGSGLVEYKFRELFVKITNDRGDIFSEIGLSRERMWPAERIVEKFHVTLLERPRLLTAADISRYVLGYYDKIFEALQNWTSTTLSHSSSPRVTTVRQHEPYIPKSTGELLEHLAFMLFYAPKFEDKTGYLPGRTIDTVFFQLNSALQNLRICLGDDLFRELTDMSVNMRRHFENDPHDLGNESDEGRVLIRRMEGLLMKGATK